MPKYSNIYTGGTITNCAFKSLWVSKGWVDPRLSESKSILSIWKNEQLKNCLEFAVTIRVLSEGQHGVVILNTDPRVPTRPVSKIGKSAKGSATKAIGPLPPQRGIGASSFGTGKRLPGRLPLETLATSPRGLTSHPSGISPSPDGTSRSGNRSKCWKGRPGNDSQRSQRPSTSPHRLISVIHSVHLRSLSTIR